MYNLKRLLLSCYVVFSTGTLLVWLHQNSLENFWQQSYHSPPPWQSMQSIEAWQAGSRVHHALASAAQVFWQKMQGQTITATETTVLPSSATTSSLNESDASCSCSAVANIPEDQIVETEPATAPDIIQPKEYAQLKEGDRVFFAGDSMMQGVAPHLAVRLRREYGISSIDLSKQSTGLAYPRAFNWPETIRTTLTKHPDIKLLIVFLGPNDPWDMPASKGGKYLRFASTEWEALYRERIRTIIQDAQAHQVDIIWVSPPHMRRKSLSNKVSYLSQLYESEVRDAGEVFLSGNQVFRYTEDTYSDYMGDQSIKQKMRTGDGIHFTVTGQRTLANAVFDLITFTPTQANYD